MKHGTITILSLVVAAACVIYLDVTYKEAMAQCQKTHSYSTCAYALR